MAYTANTPKVDGAPAVDQLLGRTVHDDIKDLVPQDCALTKFTKTMKVDSKTGKVTQSGGLIEARMSKHSLVEVYSHTPKGVTQTAGTVTDPGATSSVDIVLANAATQLHTKMMFQNTANKSVGYIDAISGTTVSFMDVGGAFSVTEGDELLYLGAQYEYGSKAPQYVTNTDDQHKNIMSIYRHPIATTLSAKDSQQLAGGNIHNRYKEYELVNHVRAVERHSVWGLYPASGISTDMTQLGTSVPHSRGLYSFAQKTYSFAGALTFEKIKKNLYLAMDRSVDPNAELIWLMSKQARAEILQLMEANSMVIRADGGNKYKKWGVKADIIMTTGPDIVLMPHDAFQWGSNISSGLIIDPKQLAYYFKDGETPKGLNGRGKAIGKGRNWNIIEEIQDPSEDVKKDEIFNEGCFLPLDGGYSMTTTTNML